MKKSLTPFNSFLTSKNKRVLSCKDKHKTGIFKSKKIRILININKFIPNKIEKVPNESSTNIIFTRNRALN